MNKSEAKSYIDIFEENCELKQEILELKDENAKLREEIRALREQIQKISVTAIGENPSAGCKMEKPASKHMKSPKVPAWLPDVLDWIKGTELAQSSLSISCWVFNQFCWPKLHGRVKAHIVPNLTFSHEWDEEGNSRARLEKDNQHVFIPIASTNPPEYIIGFKEIKFNFLDGRALKFIRSILPMLNDITIRFGSGGFYDNPKFGQISHLIPMLAKKTYKLVFSGHSLSGFARQFTNCLDKIQAFSLNPRSDSDMNLLAKWLSTPREDDKPKIIDSNNLRKYYANNLIDRIEKEFFDSTEPANFIGCISCDRFDFPIFQMENEGTNEILELYRKQYSDYQTQHFLIRHRKGEEAQRANWEEHFNFNRKSDDTIILID